MLEGGIRLSGADIRGGHTLWQEDLSELLDVLEELEELRTELEGSNAVSIQNYRMDKQIRALAEKTLHIAHVTVTHYAGGYDSYLEKSGLLDNPDAMNM